MEPIAPPTPTPTPSPSPSPSPTLHPNAITIGRFYAAFAALDADTMAACYAPEASFEDEVFRLEGRDSIAAMWGMLCQASRANGPGEWHLEFAGITADDLHGSAHWQAWYRFSATGRRVHNIINARFLFRDGLITAHRDAFNFWIWSRQALGVSGWLLGGSAWLRAKVRAQAAAKLGLFKAGRRA